MSVGTKPATPLGIGIIGAGAVLKRNALAYLSSPDLARLVAVADLDRARADAGRDFYGMEASYQDYRELIACPDIDVVSVCTRPNVHAQLVADAVRAGKHVLCEKPIAHTLAGADEIIAACERHPDVHVCCLYQWRSDPAVQLLHELSEKGHLGRIAMAHVRLRGWRPDSHYHEDAPRETWEGDGGGVLIVIAIHQLDNLIWLLGDPIEVSARMDTRMKPSEGDDALVAWVRFRSGVLASVCCSICDQENLFTVELVGERAVARFRGGGNLNVCDWEVSAQDRVTRRTLEQIAREHVPRRPLDPGPFAVRVIERWHRLRGRPWLPPKHWWHGPFVRRFLESILSGGPVPVSPREARRSLELAIAMYQSALLGTEVRLPLDPSSPIYSGVEAKHLRVAEGEH